MIHALRLAAALGALWYILSVSAVPPAAIVAAAVLVEAPDVAAVPAPASARAAWAVALASALGNEQPTPDLVAALVAWSLAEDACEQACDGGRASALESNNPWNTTMPGFNEITVRNSVGVRAYASEADGIAATVATLGGGYVGYSEIVAGIRANDVEQLFAGIHASPWCGNCYGRNIERLYEEVRR